MFLLVNRNRSEDDLKSGTVVDLNFVCPEGSEKVWLLDLYKGDILSTGVTYGESGISLDQVSDR